MDQHDLITRLQGGRYGSTVPEIIDFAKAAECTDAALAGADQRAAWLETAGLHPDKWARLLLIARAKHLHQQELAKILPTSFSTLALLSRCSEAEFKEAFSQGLINPTLTHDALADWRRSRKGTSKPEKESVIKLLPLVIAVRPDFHAIEETNVIMKLQEFIADLKIDGEVICLANWSNMNEQAIEQWQQARLEDARNEVVNLIKPRELPNLDQPMAKLKRDCTAFSDKQWKAIYAFKNAYDSVFGHDKQKRYSSRVRLQAAADKGSEFAKRMIQEVWVTTDVKQGEKEA